MKNIKDRPFERIGLIFVSLVNPYCEIGDDEILKKSYHLSTTIKDENGNDKEVGIRIPLSELYQSGTVVPRITNALMNIGKDEEYIKLYLELIEKKITKDRII